MQTILHVKNNVLEHKINTLCLCPTDIPDLVLGMFEIDISKFVKK